MEMPNKIKFSHNYLVLLPLSILLSAVLTGNPGTTVDQIKFEIPLSKFELDSIRSKNTSILRKVEEKCKYYELNKRKDN
jgi:hypothetical protein